MAGFLKVRGKKLGPYFTSHMGAYSAAYLFFTPHSHPERTVLVDQDLPSQIYGTGTIRNPIPAAPVRTQWQPP